MATIDRQGTEIYYEHHRAAVDNAPTVLLSHGYTATSGMWAAQIDAFKQTHNVITWDMRGHGRSASPDDPDCYSEALTVADMAALLDVCGATTAVVGGLSLGGYMTLAFHLVHPRRCDALMLFDTGPGYKSDKGRAGWNDTAATRAAAFERDGLAALGEGAEVRASQHRSAEGLAHAARGLRHAQGLGELDRRLAHAARGLLLDGRGKRAADRLAHAARGLLAQVDDRVIQSLPAIRCPTLVLVGENDTPFLVPTDYMASKIAGSTKVVLADAGHASNIDQPDAFNRVVVDFLAGVSP